MSSALEIDTKNVRTNLRQRQTDSVLRLLIYSEQNLIFSRADTITNKKQAHRRKNILTLIPSKNKSAKEYDIKGREEVGITLSNRAELMIPVLVDVIFFCMHCY